MGSTYLSALTAVLKETNQKYNAVMSLFAKKDGVAPMVPDGFLVFGEKEMQELSAALRICAPRH